MNLAPIPGQSLTEEPRKHAWQRPPQTEDPDEAIKYHIDRLSKPEIIDNVLDAINFGMPIGFLTELILTGGVSKGIHTIDMSYVIAPAVHEFLISTAEDAGVEYKEFFEPDVEDRQALAASLVRKSIDFAKEKDEGTQLLEELVQPVPEEDTTQQETKQGLVPRRV